MFISNAFSRLTYLDLDKSVSILSTKKLKRLNHAYGKDGVYSLKKMIKKS